MKRTRFWLVGAFVLVSALLAGTTMKARQNALFRLARYEKSPGFSDYLTYLKTRSRRFSYSEIFSIAYPLSSDYESMMSGRVNAQGNFSWGEVHPGRGGLGYSAPQKLKPAQLTEIRQLMGALPPSSAPSNRFDVLGVVLDDSTSTPALIRVYDRRHPPAQIEEICRIIQMPLDLTRDG